MNILIVSATEFEVKPLLGFLGIALPTIGMHHSNIDFEEKDIKVLITGVGMVNTALMMGRHSAEHFDLIINVGVCGAFNTDLELGQLVNITPDILSEMGAEDGEDFLTYDKLQLGGAHIFNANSELINTNNLKKVKGITVNTVHGNNTTIENVKKLYNPDVESMEGAAFFAGCNKADQFMQIRAVSNYVEKRDKSKWNMPLAIKNLNDYLIELIQSKI